jgi:phage shock protein A
MPNRKKRLEKGIESTKEAIKKHEQKLKSAISEGDEEGAGYFLKELKGMEEQVKRKEKGMGK